ncbi:acylphosphatase [Parasedimentitalea psychrophila]|uniref:Acylphosphatase n=1 Tax=Parasedimentitalea psychrophila TaxID=2997337 RepID=A0A9Y2KZM0_9RHOB|nr:acylphosphatase [Parasedimentitalea psychrophila]WIY24822.1 acylphosphatase [Parasedimentitalea psychrophila]
MSDIALRARITGRVQGVAFRAWTRSEAKQRGLSGWVRNDSDGSVLALLMGPASDVAAMVRALSQGPPAARVTDVMTENVEPDPEFTGFQIIR